MIRSLWVGLNLFVATALLSTWVLVVTLLGRRGEIYDNIGRRWAHWLLWASGVKVEAQGIENISRERPQVVASNHASWYDVWAIAAIIPGRYHFIAKQELARIPVFGQAWKAAGHISIDRSDRSAAIRSLREAGERLREENATVVIFPEGTRSPDGELLPFKKGAFMLAIHTGTEIVPTAVLGGRDVLPKGGWRVRPGRIIVRFGTPIPTGDETESDRDELIAHVRSAVETMLHEPPTDRIPTNV